MTQITLLLCPNCSSSLDREVNTLICQSCKKRYDPQSSGFYDFRFEGKFEQERGLKSQMEIDFYCNDTFKNYLIKLNKQHMVKSLSAISHQSVMDIGCGVGGMYNDVDTCHEYYGFDPSVISGYEHVSDKNHIYLIQNDVEKPFPIKNNSIDCIILCSSYDHLLVPESVIKDTWKKLKPGGHLFINMTNYGFWLKQLINKTTGKQQFKNKHEHFCVHSPDSLINEIRSFINEAKTVEIDSDFMYLPNLPKKFSWVYFSQFWINSLNYFTKFLFHKIFRMKNRGSIMTVVFQKK